MLDKSFGESLRQHLPVALNQTLPCIVAGVLNQNNEQLAADIGKRMETFNGKLDKLIADRPPADFGPMGVSPPVEDPRFEEPKPLNEMQVKTKAMQATLDSVSRRATSGYATPAASGGWGAGHPSGSLLGSPSFSPPTFG